MRDLGALCRLLLPRDTIGRLRCFTAGIQARNNDLHGPVHQAASLRALATLLEVSIHLGQFKIGPVRMPLAHPLSGGSATVEVIKTEEEGSDLNLAT